MDKEDILSLLDKAGLTEREYAVICSSLEIQPPEGVKDPADLGVSISSPVFRMIKTKAWRKINRAKKRDA